MTAMLELPTGIAEKLENRRQLRRARRSRNCRRRPKRFNNRKRPEGWIAPSQKAKVDFRLKIISELCKLYPITGFAVEDVAFDHYRKRWGSSRLAELFEETANDEEVIITQDDGSAFQIVPLGQTKPQPTFGSAKGLIKMSEDFDEPLEDFKGYAP